MVSNIIFVSYLSSWIKLLLKCVDGDMCTGSGAVRSIHMVQLYHSSKYKIPVKGWSYSSYVVSVPEATLAGISGHCQYLSAFHNARHTLLLFILDGLQRLIQYQHKILKHETAYFHRFL